MLFTDPDFVHELVKHTGYQPTVDELSGPPHKPHAEFERRYAAFVAESYSELTLFGLDFSRRDHSEWPLDTAYLSLEPAPHHGRDQESGGLEGRPAGSFQESAVGERQRVEAAFARQTRILLRGQAGSGKTTLVQ
ncbi:hypothetical protein [Streptomyces gilvosporeus]|uniref:NACHT domain-containing protein n=1 Tax=Streptomyces gilvosporeus TaxID=553510 RepID=A0A1V0TZM3_9ACTN|nr:hypothetical protein [Streptomyces gilvosporeus]ARF58394.1 hypothetical protein B1H19_33175 [Streptomyces gilvosporeus]